MNQGSGGRTVSMVKPARFHGEKIPSPTLPGCPILVGCETGCSQPGSLGGLFVCCWENHWKMTGQNSSLIWFNMVPFTNIKPYGSLTWFNMALMYGLIWFHMVLICFNKDHDGRTMG